MKTLFITTIAFLAFTITCKAQWAQGTGIITTTNSVGIGTTSPIAKLDVNGAQRLNGDLTFAADVTAYFIHGPGNGGAIRIRSNIGNANDRNVQLGSIDNNGTWTSFMTVDQTGYVGIGTTAPLTPLDIKLTTNQHVQFVANLNGGYPGLSGIVCLNDANSGYTPLGFFASNYYFGGGNVGIGTTDTKGYTFAVNGTTIATSMTVKAYANWPDYVFKPTYRLASLTEVKTYIDQNHHLPNVPSAADVEKNGLNLGEMNKVLVQKVEELTLYLIEKDKEQTELKETIKKLAQRIQVLEKN
jgi:hypothetical protein